MRNLALTVLFITIGQLVSAQYNWDFGVRAGGANYLGEFGGKDKPARSFVMDMKLKQTRWNAGAFARYRVMNNVAVNLGFNYIRLEGADSLTTYAPRRSRNLHFKNDIFELSLRGEYYFYAANDVGGTGRYQLDFKSYLFGGVGGFYHNPKARYNGSMVALQPLETEGVSYSKFQLSIPVGVGVYFTYLKKHRFGWEFNWRTTFTDYIDDASNVYQDPNNFEDPTAADLANRRDELPDVPDGDSEFVPAKYYGVEGAIRGNPDDNDSYITTTLYYSYVLRGGGKFYRSKYNYIYGGKRKKRRTRAKF